MISGQDEIKKRIDFWNEIQDEFKIDMLSVGGYRLSDGDHHIVGEFQVYSDSYIANLMFNEIKRREIRGEYNRIRSMFDEVKQIQNGWIETE